MFSIQFFLKKILTSIFRALIRYTLFILISMHVICPRVWCECVLYNSSLINNAFEITKNNFILDHDWNYTNIKIQCSKTDLVVFPKSLSLCFLKAKVHFKLILYKKISTMIKLNYVFILNISFFFCLIPFWKKILFTLLKLFQFLFSPSASIPFVFVIKY